MTVKSAARWDRAVYWQDVERSQGANEVVVSAEGVRSTPLGVVVRTKRGHPFHFQLPACPPQFTAITTVHRCTNVLRYNMYWFILPLISGYQYITLPCNLYPPYFWEDHCLFRCRKFTSFLR